MIDDLVCQREILITKEMKHTASKDVLFRVMEEAKNQLVNMMKDELAKKFPFHVPPSAIHVTSTSAPIHATREELVRLKAVVRGRDIEHAGHMADMTRHPVTHYSKPLKASDWEIDASKYIGRFEIESRANTQLLKAILDEALPNWRDVYDRLEPIEKGSNAIEPFKQEYLRRYAGLRPDSFILDDYARKD